MKPRHSRAPGAVALLTVLCAVLAACAPNPADPSSTRSTMPSESPTKSGTGELRHDLEPLVSRIPALSAVEEATWLSGTLGDPGVPGPSLYWIDAVVVLPSEAADGMRASLDLEPAAQAPDAADGLDGALPEGDLLQGPALDEAFSAGEWRTTAYLEAQGNRLVLLVVGE
ncbi:hypothetical protein [Cellulomonas chengniuliangii]|uniref:hypothetical protein n=1 Tax=Cellulomonas chengniuliangii TaxID=2968084 RepID=UPI001D0E1EBF|nr:hypothetical protein [Cellulomonas chengniuliangii]MCC2317925.1 hypothetical protein [Cellulomonas chengniuliangii]